MQYSILNNQDFPWNYNAYIVSPGDKRALDRHQFTHVFFQKSHQETSKSIHYPVLSDLIDKINPSDLLRVKANLGIKTSEHIEGGFHTDTPLKHNTAIFYLNTNNGYTKFKDGTVVDTIANRLVVFDSNLLHSGFSQTDKNARCVINLNYIGGLSGKDEI
jgi:hypothetical protein